MVYIIILNWNGWSDTIECLESVFRLRHTRYRVIVLDNGSEDASMRRIEQWALGELPASVENPSLAHLTVPPVAKPVRFASRAHIKASSALPLEDAPLTLVQNGANLGFAAGCNVGLRLALSRGDCEFAWLLNNDTVVAPDALDFLVREMQEHPEIGLCGSKLVSYYNPTHIQAVGGTRYNPWTGRTPKSSLSGGIEIPRLACILGCSMLVSRRFLEVVGLMEESYFLYFEELDWAIRGKNRFSLGVSISSHVFHKEGASIGSSSDRSLRSPMSERYLTRNRVLFTKRFYPWCLPSVMLFVILAAIQRGLSGDRALAKLMIQSAIEGLRCAGRSSAQIASSAQESALRIRA